jgi:ribosome-binding protein aMBF1 (putative translation factor)
MKLKKSNKDKRIASARTVMTKSCVLIQYERLRLKISIEDLAAKSGVSVGVIKRIESECWIEFFEDFGRIVLALNMADEIDETLSSMLPQ